ncbi:MAG: hypothetical protein V3S69_04830 [Dehalococcoidales bacterium]|nr:hypothetical protein [Candidatus Bathyarchaeota archaeon]|tara:strand:+ start:174 stop:515 length:342 start_codon:yes stop_codon:yes gene_type:complete
MVKDITAGLHKAINVMTDELEMQKNLITLMDTLIAHGIEDNGALESVLNATHGDLNVALYQAFKQWCKDEDIDTADEFTSKIEEMGNELDEYRSNVQSELNDIASAIDNIEGL